MKIVAGCLNSPRHNYLFGEVIHDYDYSPYLPYIADTTTSDISGNGNIDFQCPGFSDVGRYRRFYDKPVCRKAMES
ncbi:MAG: hypothetical protein PHV95_00630 [Eubacteriales bacterium]|nr:hypothetical protein [Eubacteriales bacterium]